MSETVCEMCNREGCPRKVLSLMSLARGPQWALTIEAATAQCSAHVVGGVAVNYRDEYLRLRNKVVFVHAAKERHSLRTETARGGDGFVHQACGHNCTGCDLREALAALVRP